MSDIFKDLKFPNTFNEPYVEATSPSSPKYNCIAWAANIKTEKYWPDPYGVYKWPDDIVLEETLEAFIQFYNKFGYEKTTNGDYKDGFLKIAIFAKNGIPTHAARQISDTKWTSKLGDNIDVQHSLGSLEDGFYGDVVLFMEKKVTMFEKRTMKLK